jgi:ACS family hexuronate transporter-like MFS transporter
MKIRHLRWWLCGLLFVATALSFLDRQVLSVVAPVVTEEFRMGNTDYSYVTTAFMLSYAVMFFLSGRLMDLLGTRIGMALSVGVWSLASALHATAQNALHLGVFRFLLGAGEGGCFPGATKGATEWFPPRERAFAIGIAIGGAALGGVLAPPLTVCLVRGVGWRGAFLATGLLGMTWLALWWLFYHTPATSPFVTAEERAYVEARSLDSVRDGMARPPEAAPPSLLTLLARKEVWGLSLVRFLVDPVFYFYMFWIPKYLSQERGVSLEEIGQLTWIPFLALGLSNIAGGWVSDKLTAAGISSNKARKTVMAAAALLTVSSSSAAFAGSTAAAVGIMSLLMFAHGFWITNYVTLISEIFPKNAVATVMGLAGMVGTVGGMLANTTIGFVADRFSFLPIWIASGCMYPLALGVLLLTIPYVKESER